MRLFANFTKAQRAFLKSIRDKENGPSPQDHPKPGTLDSWLQNPKFKECYEMLLRDIQREIDLHMLLLQRKTARALVASATQPLPLQDNPPPQPVHDTPPRLAPQLAAGSSAPPHPEPPSRNQSIKEYRLCLAHQRQRAKAPKPTPPQPPKADLTKDDIDAWAKSLRHPNVSDEEARALFGEDIEEGNEAKKMTDQNAKEEQNPRPTRKDTRENGWQTEGDCGANPPHSDDYHVRSEPTDSDPKD